MSFGDIHESSSNDSLSSPTAPAVMLATLVQEKQR